jgi:hypothetical protein
MAAVGERFLYISASLPSSAVRGSTEVHVSVIVEILLSFIARSTARLPVGNITINHYVALISIDKSSHGRKIAHFHTACLAA